MVYVGFFAAILQGELEMHPLLFPNYQLPAAGLIFGHGKNRKKKSIPQIIHPEKSI